jgi:alpha-methylacyl-CoA racemase
MSEPNLPLAGLKVLDLSRLLPGPFCTRILADLGAQVVKIEEPGGGDYLRAMPPLLSGTSAHFLALNGGKRSVTLDLKASAGQQVLRRLLAEYDILVESFRPGVLDRMGLHYHQLQPSFPRLIYASLTGYGQTGPYRLRAGHDANFQAIAGSISLNGPADGSPVIPGLQSGDISGALYTAIAILAAVHGRAVTGRGRHIDLAMADTTLATMVLPMTEYLATGEAPGPSEQSVSGQHLCYAIYRTADDRHMCLAALEPKFFGAFCAAVERPELAGDGYTPARPGNPAYEAVVEIFAGRTMAEWIEFFADVDCCCEPVLRLDEVATHPQIAVRGGIETVVDPVAGEFQRLAQPFVFDPPVEKSRAAAPQLGEHTKAVLTEIGVTAGEFSEFSAAGAFGEPTEA